MKKTSKAAETIISKHASSFQKWTQIIESLIEASKIKDTCNPLPSLPLDVNGGLQVTYQSNIIKSNYNFGFDPENG